VKDRIDPIGNRTTLISYPENFEKSDENFQSYLKNSVINSHLAQTMDGKASYLIKKLIEAYLENPKQLPDGTILTLMKNSGKRKKYSANKAREEVEKIYNEHDNKRFMLALRRTITDFIAGMTDKFAITQYRMLYGSNNFWIK